MAQKRPQPIKTRNGIPLTREEYRQLKKQKEREERRKRQEAWEAARGPLDLPFLLLAMLLLAVGLIMLLSASFPTAQSNSRQGNDALYYFKRQVLFAGLGLFAMFWVSKINYERFRGLARLALFGSIGLLILVVIPGPNKYGRLLALGENGAARWLGIPSTSLTFQPSEVAKLGIIIYFAESISKKREKMRTFKWWAASTGAGWPPAPARWAWPGTCCSLRKPSTSFSRPWTITPPACRFGGTPSAAIWPSAGTTPGRPFRASTPSAPEGFWAWDWAKAGKSSATSPRRRTTTSSPWSWRSWDWWAGR